ncbi:NAD-binding protein [Kribbella aluminosa]
MVVCGSSRTMVRVVTELVSSGERVIALVNPASRHRGRIGELGAKVIDAPVISESLLRQAGINAADDGTPSAARALVLLDTDDVHNVHTALTARDMDRDLRIIMQMVNPRLGSQLNSLLGDCVVINGPSLAAPAFVSDALDDDELTWMELGGRMVVVGEADLIREPHLTVLADATSSATPVLLPEPDDEEQPDPTSAEPDDPEQAGRASAGTVEAEQAGSTAAETAEGDDEPKVDIVLGTGIRPVWYGRRVRPAGWAKAVRDVLDSRVRKIAALMAMLIAIGTAIVHFFGGIDWWRALYLAAGVVTTAGIDDNRFSDAPPWVKVSAVVVQLTGIVLMALLTAVVVDSLIGARLSRIIGGVRGRPRNHVVVCGLGTVGARVLEILVDRGVAVVGVDQDDDAPGVQVAHRLKVPVVVGDSSNEETLRLAGVQHCQAMLAITDGDITNLESAMVAQGLNPDARITMRMFDHDLADRVERQLGLGNSRSVSMLVAPAVAAAVGDKRRQVLVPAGRRVLLLTEVVVEADSHAEGRTLGQLREAGGLRVLARQTSHGPWDWQPTQTGLVKAGDRLAVVGTRAGLARLLMATRAQRRTMASERIGL